MGVDSVSGATTAAATSTADLASKKAQVNYDTFLKLLVAEMKNQDPTKPMDSTQQVAQLATFSQLEQSIKTNKNLETLLQSSNLTQAGSLIGRTMISHDGSVTGVIKEVKVNSNGLTAVLDNGNQIKVEQGVTIK